MTSWSSSIKIRFLQALLKKCHGVTQKAKKCAIGETKFEVFILERQRIDQKRKKGWGRGRRERIEKGRRERIEKGSRRDREKKTKRN